MKLSWIVKLVPIAVLSVGLTSLSVAQSAGPTGGSLAPAKPGNGARHPILDALAKLTLTPDQKTKIKALEKARNEDVMAFRKANQGNTAAIRAHAEEATKTFVAGIKGVLTQPQWQQFLAELKAMRGNRAGNGAGAGATPPAKS